MQEVTITPVTQTLVPQLDTALRELAAHLGDPFLTDQARLAAAVCGPGAVCLALLAMREDDTLGALLAAPVFSTMRGGAGLFVSDLWVAEAARGQGLARRLLARALEDGRRLNAGRFLKLAVYQDNPGARGAYERLGFAAQTGETSMVLNGPSLDALRRSA